MSLQSEVLILIGEVDQSALVVQVDYWSTSPIRRLPTIGSESTDNGKLSLRDSSKIILLIQEWATWPWPNLRIPKISKLMDILKIYDWWKFCAIISLFIKSEKFFNY